MIRWSATVSSWLTVATLLPALAASQPAPAQLETTSTRPAWRVIPALAGVITYDDNVFLLAPTKMDNMDVLSANEIASGRYTDMESSSDVVPTVEAALEFRGDGAGGRRLSIVPEVRYEYFTSNTRRSNARLGLTVEQSLPGAGRLRLRERFTPDYFSKNYLYDGVDEDSSRTIESGERRYTAGTYAENELWLDWRTRLARRKKSRPVGAALELGAGYLARTYDDPFPGRDLAGPMFAAELDLDTGDRTGWGLQYELDALSANPTVELLLLDEPDFGLDLNGNGNSSDRDVPTYQVVDRSRTEHALGASFRLDASDKTAVRAFLGWRLRVYSSDGEYDVNYRDREDRRLEFGAEVRMKVHPDANLTLGGELARQTTNRAGDPGSTGDEDDYQRVHLFAALTYRR